MNLFINTVSRDSIIILFDRNRDILSKKSFSIVGEESSIGIEVIKNFLTSNKLGFFDIKNIVLVNGPGSFTGIRSIVLIVNTISFITKCNLTAISYFDLFNKFPIVKSASKKDCFLKEDKNTPIKIEDNKEIYKIFSKKVLYGDAIIEDLKIFENINYLYILKKVKFCKNKTLDPFYIKKPSIN